MTTKESNDDACAGHGNSHSSKPEEATPSSFIADSGENRGSVELPESGQNRDDYDQTHMVLSAEERIRCVVDGGDK
ncbi:hypothetical protein [Arthrobacter alpinus]|uniref:hypothetical protein n=1 Tax=Arthrobacter alpinus TaxID=656366 RepID=UPI00101AD464|nr:hypothetical protein [Arthrobacter alpinus]